MSDDLNNQPTAKTGIGKFIGAALVAVALIAFVVQNTDSTPVQWFFIESQCAVVADYRGLRCCWRHSERDYRVDCSPSTVTDWSSWSAA